MQTYLDRLLAVGVSLGDAVIIIDDFLCEHDTAGLETYCAELERLHELLTDVEKNKSKPVR